MISIPLLDLSLRTANTAIGLWLVIIFMLPATVHAQKRKKNNDDLRTGLSEREAEFYFTEGEKYFILEDYAKSLIYYQRAVESNPQNGTIHYKIAEVLSKSSKQEDLIKAAASIENALKLDKTNKYFYLSAATIYNSMADFTHAAQAYEQMLAEVKGTEEYIYEVAAVYQYANEIDKAINAYDRAEKFFGVNEVSSLQKLRLYLDTDRIKEGLAEGEKLLAAFPDEEKYVMAFTEVLSQKGMRNEAIQYLEKFIAANSESQDVKMLLAGFYRDTNQEMKARPLLLALFDDNTVDISSKLIVLGEYNAELNALKSKGQTDQDKADFTLKLFEKLLATNPEHPSVHVIGGDLYLSTGKMREAQREYLLAIESGDANFELWENLIYIELQLEQYDNVIRHSDQALEIFPSQGMLYYFNGYAHLRKHDFTESVAALEQAKRFASSNQLLISEINAMLGDGYNSLKEYAKSDKSYEDALTFNANNEGVLNNYSYFLALRKDNLEKAEKMSSTLVKNNPDNPTYLDTYAWVLYVRQKYKEARKVIEKAISTGNANATHFEHYGDILYQLGDVNGAVIQWEKARGMNAKSEVLNKKIANRKIYE